MEQKVNTDVNKDKQMPENKHLYFLHNVSNKENPSYQFCAINNALIVHDNFSKDNLKVNRIDLQVNKNDNTYDISLFCNKVTDDNKEIIVPCGICEYEDVKKLVEDVVNNKYFASLYINGAEVYNPINVKMDKNDSLTNEKEQNFENNDAPQIAETKNNDKILPTLNLTQNNALPVQDIPAPATKTQEKQETEDEKTKVTKTDEKDTAMVKVDKENSNNKVLDKTPESPKEAKPEPKPAPAKKEEKKVEKKKERKKISIPLWSDYLKPLTNLSIKVVTVFLIVAAFIGAFPAAVTGYIIFGALFANIFADQIIEKCEKAVKDTIAKTKETTAIMKNNKQLRQCRRVVRRYEKEKKQKLAQKKELSSLAKNQVESKSSTLPSNDKNLTMSM